MANRPFRNIRIDNQAAEEIRDRFNAENMNGALRDLFDMRPRRGANWNAGVYGVDAEVFAVLDAAARAAGVSINALVRRRLGMDAVATHAGCPRTPADGVSL